MLKKRPKERLPEQVDPGDPEPEFCAPGSIEQKLDMCEAGTLRGDTVQFSHGRDREVSDELGETPDLVDLMGRYEMDLAERDREGDEMSGDDHSSGLQGGEQEIENQIHIDSGVPGSRTRRAEHARKEELGAVGGEMNEDFEASSE